MTLGEIIKEYREQHHLSQSAFARMSGLSKSYISLLELNRHPKTGKPIAPSIESIRLSASAMHMDFDDLFSKIDSGVVLNSNHPYTVKEDSDHPYIVKENSDHPYEVIKDSDNRSAPIILKRSYLLSSMIGVKNISALLFMVIQCIRNTSKAIQLFSSGARTVKVAPIVR